MSILNPELKDSPSLLSRILPCLTDRNMQIGTSDHTGTGHLRNASPGKAKKIRIMKKASGYETAVKKRGNDQQDQIQICEKRSMNISFQDTFRIQTFQNDILRKKRVSDRRLRKRPAFSRSRLRYPVKEDFKKKGSDDRSFFFDLFPFFVLRVASYAFPEPCPFLSGRVADGRLSGLQQLRYISSRMTSFPLTRPSQLKS